MKLIGYGLEGQASIPGTVMIFSRPTFIPTAGLDISSSRHEMKGRVRIYSVANNTPTKRAWSVRPNAFFSMIVKRKLNFPAGN
jgi:hypothetical protein